MRAGYDRRPVRSVSFAVAEAERKQKSGVPDCSFSQDRDYNAARVGRGGTIAAGLTMPERYAPLRHLGPLARHAIAGQARNAPQRRAGNACS